MGARMVAMAGNPRRCHLCGFPIPPSVVSPTHPLFGTVDHVIPTSKDGPNHWTNRKPTHRMCNQEKADELALTEKQIFRLRGTARSMLERMGIPIPRSHLRHGLPSIKPSKKHAKGREHAMQYARWEDDGGAPLNV